LAGKAGEALERWRNASPDEREQLAKEKQERMEQIVHRKNRGETFTTIARDLDLSVVQVSHDYKRFLRDLHDVEHRDIIAMKAREVLRLERLMEVKMPAAETGDDASIRSVLMLQRQLCQIVRLFAPARLKIDVKNNRSMTDALDPVKMQEKMVDLYKRLKNRGKEISPEFERWAQENIVEGEVVQDSGLEGPCNSEISATNEQNAPGEPQATGGS
jgi:hypothetical protein